MYQYYPTSYPGAYQGPHGGPPLEPQAYYSQSASGYPHASHCGGNYGSYPQSSHSERQSGQNLTFPVAITMPKPEHYHYPSSQYEDPRGQQVSRCTTGPEFPVPQLAPMPAAWPGGFNVPSGASPSFPMPHLSAPRERIAMPTACPAPIPMSPESPSPYGFPSPSSPASTVYSSGSSSPTSSYRGYQ